MNDKPMIFNGDMVRALLDGRKVQTRRLVKPQPHQSESGIWYIPRMTDKFVEGAIGENWMVGSPAMMEFCPYGKTGGLIWVRETFSKYDDGLVYRATHKQLDGVTKWTPSIHMPRWASRLTLRITNVRVERLQDISAADAAAEGCQLDHWITGVYPNHDPGVDYDNKQLVNKFKNLWGSIYNNWNDNPWVWVYEFEVIKANIDDVQ